MDELSELVSVCRAIDTDKVTERKRQIDKLRLLLNKNYVLRALDLNTDKKAKNASHHKVFGWDTLFKVVKTQVRKEADMLRKGKESQSAITLNNREKKRREIFDLLKDVVRLTDKRGERLKVSDVTAEIEDVLQDDYLFKQYGLDYSVILLKDILSKRVYWKDIPNSRWHFFLGTYLDILKEDSGITDRVLLTRLIHAIVLGASLNCDLRPKKILPAFNDYVANIRNERSQAPMENMVAASNILCRHWAPNARLQICGFGERVIISLLHVWQKHPSEHVKDQLIEFFSLQMSAHHPGGVKLEAEGAFAVDWDMWKGHMRKIYDAMYKSLEDIQDRSRFQISTREATVLKPNLVDLIADLCNQLFTNGVNILEITQLNIDAQPGGAPKRRKVETGWDVIRDKISGLGTSVQLVPWLQVLCRLLTKHPSSLPDEVVAGLLSTLYQSQNDCRRADVLSWLHQCIIALAQCQNANIIIDLEVLWQKVWSNTIRCVSAHPGVASGWHLLCVLMNRGLVTNHRELWSLFMQQMTPCSQPAIVLLATALKSLDLPDKISSGLLMGSQLSGMDSGHPHQFRCILLNWLMPSTESDTEQPLAKRLTDNPQPSLLANIVVMLTLRNTQDIAVPHEAVEVSPRQSLEDLYLEATFNATLRQYGDTEKAVKHDASVPSHLPSVQDRAFELLQRDAEMLLQMKSSDADIGQLEHATYLAAVVVQVLQVLVVKKVIKLDQVKQMPIWETAVGLMKLVSGSFSHTVKKEGIMNLSKTLELLGEMFKGDEDDVLENNQQRAAVFRAVVPPILLEKIADLITYVPSSLSRTSSTGQAQGSSQTPSTSRNTRDLDIDMDLDEAPVVDDLDMDENFNLSCGNDMDSQDSGSQGGKETSLFSTTLLKDFQRLGLQAAEVLCSWCDYESRYVIPQTPADASTVRSKLLGLLENFDGSAPWNPKDPYHLQLMKVIFRNVTTSGHKLTDDDLEILLQSLRQVCKHFRRDQDICREMLNLIGLLLKSLNLEERLSSDRQGVRKDTLHLLGVFWKLRVKQYTYITRLAVAECMRTVVKCDEQRKWSFWEVRNEDGEVESKTYLADECLQLLKDDHHSIRQIAVQSLQVLFSTHGDLGSVDFKRKQEEVFEDIYDLLHELLNVEGDYSSDELRDMSANRTASLLHSLGAIAIISPVCEKKAIFAVFQMAKENKINSSLICKVLKQVSQAQQSDSLEGYMKSHLPYVVHHWLDLDYSVQQLPFQFFGFSTQKDFLSENALTLLPFMIKKKDITGVKWVASQLNQDWRVLVRTSLPGVLIHILPWFALSKSGNLSQNQQTMAADATSCYDLLVKHISHEDIEIAIAKNLPEIVVDLLMTLYDRPADQSERGIGAPEPNFPHFPRKLITMTLDYLRKGHGGDTKSIVSLLCKTQDGVQQVLKSLHWHLLSERTVHEKYRVLQMYCLYVGLLLQEVDGDLGGSWPFVVREVIYTLAHVLRSLSDKQCDSLNYYERQIITEAISILRGLCEVACHCTSQKLSAKETLGEFLPVLVTSVVPYVKDREKQGEECVEFLEYLVLECGDTLRDSLKLLDPLPELPKLIRVTVKLDHLKYADGEFTLLQEIQHFVNVGQHYTSGKNINRLRGLQFLRKQLSSRKKELTLLMKTHVEQVDEDSIVTALLSELMHLAKSDNAEVSKEAANCLGEIGPVDLATMTLRVTSPRDKVVAAAYGNNGLCKMYCQILYSLDEYLLHEKVEVVDAASVVLKRILSTKTGYEFAAHHEAKIPGDLTLNFLFPFRTSKKKVFDPSNEGEGSEKFVEFVDKLELWQPGHNNHGVWVRDLAIALLESGAVKDHVLYLLGPVCKVKMEFCEAVLPYLVHDILANGDSEHEKILSTQIGLWLENHCEQRQLSSRSNTPFGRTSSASPQSICNNLASVQTIINIIQYLRLQNKDTKRKSTWDNNFWLDINYLNVAEAALNCNLHFSAIMYAELWCYIVREKKSEHARGSQVEDQFSQNNYWEMMGSVSKEDAARAQNLMLQAYRSLGAPDAIYGCRDAKTADSEARIKMYEHEGQWDKALSSYDLQISHEPTASNLSGLLQALQNFGLHQVLDSYLQGVALAGDEMEAELQNFQYQAAWRNSKWDLHVTSRFDSNCGFQQSLYNSLWSIKEQDASLLIPALDQARKCVAMEIHQGHQESVRSFYPYLSKLLCLSQVTDLASIDISDIDALEEVQNKWTEQNSLLDNDYSFIEPVLAVRGALTKMVYELSGKMKPTLKIYMKTLEDMARSAREAGRHQIGEKAIYQLQICGKESSETSWSWQIEEAKFFWGRQEYNVGKDLLKELIDKLESVQDESREAAYLYPRCLGLYGDWLASTHSASPDEILDDYLIKAVEELEQLECEDDAALDAFLSLARFADAQYQHIDDYMKSPVYEAKRALATQAKEDAEQLKKLGDNGRYLRTLEKQSAIDAEELARMLADKERFLKHAIQNYVKCLQCGSKHDLRVFRLTSLWFANLADSEVNTCIKNGLERISTHKFLPLMYQLAARMSSAATSNDEFQYTLDKLIESVILDHPYHSLYIVLALAHATKDDDPSITGAASASAPGKKTGRLSKSNSLQKQEDRVTAAQELVHRLKSGKRAGIVRDTEKLCLAYIQLAYHNVEKHRKDTKPIPLPSSIVLPKLSKLQNVVVPTIDLPVDFSCKYQQITYLEKFGNTFKLAGGINLPKIISCIGSDGVSRRQLVKGQDDLRQDAVMQQVFGLVNNLLSKEAETRKRKLKVRTYKVIPLSQRSGLLEWCEGTIPLGDYLVGTKGEPKKGAHHRYRPNDITALECWNKLAEAHKKNRPRQPVVFLEVCRKFQPVFRHFFLENYPEPADWYQHHLNYRRSVATNSIVGYILGLGDRHVANILIDTQTAELIHIDLGVAFEQGKILPTPETVPFRLTRDLVDGMGVSGVEGDFRRCCEETMKVMHQSHEALLTILQVLLYDPLYTWTLSPQKAMILQQRRAAKVDADVNNMTVDIMEMSSATTAQREGEPVNQVAERVLLRLQQKLQGIETGVQLSVSGQVNHLIQQARDPNNLGRLFPGWQPYL